MKLSQMTNGQTGKIINISIQNKELKQRFMELGITRGQTITVERHAPLGDPMEIKINQSHIAIRINEAEAIEVA